MLKAELRTAITSVQSLVFSSLQKVNVIIVNFLKLPFCFIDLCVEVFDCFPILGLFDNR